MFKFVLPVESTPIATVPDATIYQLTTEELDRLRDLPKRECMPNLFFFFWCKINKFFG